MRLRDANWIRMRAKKFLNYNYSSSPIIKYLTAIIDENGDFQITSMCRFPREEDYKTFLSYNVAVDNYAITSNSSYWWANDNISAGWTPNDNFSNYNSYYNNWSRFLGNPYNTYIDSSR